MKAVVTRPASAADLDALLRFEDGLVGAERGFDPTLQNGNVHYYDIEGMLADANVRFVVAQSGEEILGCGFARIERSKPYLKHPQHAYLGLMFVVPSHRGEGINQRIVEDLTGWCREQKITELRLEVYQDNRAAIKAYEKTGFIKHIVQMRMALDD